MGACLIKCCWISVPPPKPLLPPLLSAPDGSSNMYEPQEPSLPQPQLSPLPAARPGQHHPPFLLQDQPGKASTLPLQGLRPDVFLDLRHGLLPIAAVPSLLRLRGHHERQWRWEVSHRWNQAAVGKHRLPLAGGIFPSLDRSGRGQSLLCKRQEVPLRRSGPQWARRPGVDSSIESTRESTNDRTFEQRL